MASTAQKREWYSDWECNRDKMVRHPFPMPEGVIHLLVADVTVPAWQVFTALMEKHSYYFREMAGGTYNCRNIAGSDKKSLHSYGIAVDLNPSVNRVGQNSHDFPQGFIDDVLGTGLFRWGQVFNDPMHWEIDVAPEEIDMAMTPEAQQFWQDAFDKLGELEPPTDHTFAYWAVRHLRESRATLSASDVKAIINDSQIVAP